MTPRWLPAMAAVPLIYGRTAVAQEGWRCYNLTYSASAASDLAYFPARLALHGQGPIGAVVSKPHPTDSIGFWRMFQTVESQWQRESGDSLSAHFTNGFTFAELRLARGTSTRSGRALIHFDFGDPSQHPRADVLATLVPCLQTDTTGPERDPDAIANRAHRLQQLAFQNAERDRLRGVPSPARGTYRLHVAVPGLEPRTVFLRTAERPAEPVWTLNAHYGGVPDTLHPGSRAQGYRLEAVVAVDLASLPNATLSTDRDGAATAGLVVAVAPDSVSSDGRMWQASTDALFALSRLSAGHSDYAQLLAASRAVNDVWYDGYPGSTEGSLTATPQGGMRLRVVITRGDVVVLAIHGERLNEAVLRDR